MVLRSTKQSSGAFDEMRPNSATGWRTPRASRKYTPRRP